MSQYSIQPILSGVAAGDAKIRIEVDGKQNPIYIGKAKAGSDESASVWQIQYMTYNSQSALLTRDWANGEPTYVNAWTNRAALSYS